jgi:hypothetical protein
MHARTRRDVVLKIRLELPPWRELELVSKLEHGFIG